jgi:hypothetical protein
MVQHLNVAISEALELHNDLSKLITAQSPLKYVTEHAMQVRAVQQYV